MKIKLLVVISLMVVMSAAMVAPVMADETGNTTITGNPTAYVALTINSATVAMTLIPPGVNSDTSNHLDAAANCPSAIKAKDALTDSKPSSSAGFMVNATTGGIYNLTETEKLGTAMGISGTTVGVFTTSTITALTAVDQTLYTGSGAGPSQELALSFNQAVAYSDKILPTGYSYRIPVTFIITVA
jgi:hypothetical protein